jgi:murein DD-endopeptidase MepM/ murein hydrolase activator NlpD
MAASGVGSERAAPIVIAFPLRGEGWVAVTSPADRVPSHGTDLLAQRYAIDLLRTERRSGRRYHPAGALWTLLLGVPTSECYAWGAPIHAPFPGEVVRAVDGIGERGRVHPVREALLALRTAATYRPERLPAILGDHVILRRADGVHAGMVHLAPGSVAVRAGQVVQTGEVLGRVGHSGNSTSPHLHLQLMDGPDPLVARGLPFVFAAYEVERDGRWVRVERAVPGRADRLRSVPDDAPPDPAPA